MSLHGKPLVTAAILCSLLLVTAQALAQAGPGHRAPHAADQPSSTSSAPQPVLLDTYGFWRMYHQLQAPVIEAQGKLTPITYGFQWMDMDTSAPPDNWAAVEFDDSSWLRGPARMACRTPYLSRLCLRGYFSVANPAQAAPLKLTVLYHGGIVVYLNGREIARQDLPQGPIGPTTLATPYPLDAFLDANGKLLKGWDKAEKDMDADTLRRVTLRTRTLADVLLPKDLLRQGTNVLAVEILRTSYPPHVDSGKVMKGFATVKASRTACQLEFNTCQLTGLQLKADSVAGFEGNAVRSPGLRVWNSDVIGGDFDQDFGGQGGEPLRPVRIVGVRNGAFSGKFVVGSTEPLRRLKVTVGDLTGPGAKTIPASAVQIRYAQPWGRESGAYGIDNLAYDKSLDGTLIYRYQKQPTLLGALWDAPPDEIAVASGRDSRYFTPDTRLPASPRPVPGAVAPVWITVRVPREAAAGEYTGTAMVQVEGAPPMPVPLRVQVADWTLPDPGQFTAWVDMIQSPDTLALEYGTALWSDAHWKHIDRSLDLLRGVGNKVIYLPLIAETNLGNAESLVRWIDKGNGQYGFDLTLFDKYLDHVVQHMGEPGILVLYAWEIYFTPSKQLKPLNDELELPKSVIEAKKAAREKGPVVTLLDLATGQTSRHYLPQFSDPAIKPVWQALFAEVRRHLEQRKLWQRAMLGTMSDAWPSKAEADFLGEVSGHLPWFADSHMGAAGLRESMEVIASGKASKFTLEQVYPTVKNANDEISVLDRIRYSARVWSNVFNEQNPTGDSLMGWKRTDLYVQHDRHADVHPMSRWHYMPEQNIVGQQHGVGRLGGDWWSCVKDKQGRRVGVARERYPQSMWRNLDMNIQTMAPGPDGAVVTHRFENLREGLQECEARIFIERALSDPQQKEKVGPELVQKAQEMLRRRANLITKASSSLQMGGADHFFILNARGFFQWTNLAGHCWNLSSDWQGRNEELFAMAAAVAAKVGQN